MRYFIVSQNLARSHMKFPKNAILRVNLAWLKDLKSIKKMLNMHKGHDIFLDIPVGRKKPPNHKHDINEIANIANSYKNVKYVAVSNVESASDIAYYCKKFNSRIVPKIETYRGVMHSANIINALNYKPQIVMLDHEDLFSNLVSIKKEKLYLEVIDRLIKACERKRAHLLRVKGIIFTND